jgi:predicted transcriptional regulator
MPSAADVVAARIACGLTQADAAALAGYGSQSRWAEIESGTRRMDAVRWRYWCHVAGIERIPYRAR